MFLNELGDKKKKLFFDLCVHASLSDNEFADEERMLLDEYCDEMQIIREDYTIDRSVDEILEELSEICTYEEKNIILIEVVALLISDDIYDNMEKKLINKLQKALDISDEKVKDTFEAINELSEVYKKFEKIIEE